MISALALALRRMNKRKRKNRRRRSRRLSDGKTDFFSNLINSSKPGAPKQELPYTIPPIETVITIDDKTERLMKTVAFSITGGIVIGAVARVGAELIKSNK